MWTSQVDAQSFRGDLDKSMTLAGYKAADTSKTKLSVDANLQDLNQPMFGFTFDLVTIVVYTVSDDRKKQQIPVVATGTATTSDTFVGMERLRIANERSIEENIKLFLSKLAGQIGASTG